MKPKSIIVCAAIAALFIAGCSTEYEALLASGDVDAKYTEAFKLFHDKKYKKAASMFESLSMLTSGTSKDDTVRYFWALSNYRNKDYLTAQANFENFVEVYPRSPFTPEARFLKLDCLYRSTYRYELDQNPTHVAIIQISEFIMECPQSDKIPICKKMLEDLNMRLDTKEFENARLYYKMEDYIASRKAFKNILKDNSKNIYREQIMYYIAMSAYKYAFLSVPAKQKERYMEFVDEYYNFIGENPDSEYRKELDRLYNRYQQTQSGGIVSGKELRRQMREDKKAEKQIDKK